MSPEALAAQVAALEAVLEEKRAELAAAVEAIDERERQARRPAIVRLTITDHEGLIDSPVRGKSFDTVDEMDAALRYILTADPPNGGYRKTWFTIEFSDGHTHAGRIDLSHTMSGEPADILGHVCGFVKRAAEGVAPRLFDPEEAKAIYASHWRRYDRTPADFKPVLYDF